MEQQRSLDWMCIRIEKVAETNDDAQYGFVSDVYEPNPTVLGRMMVVGQNRGVLRIAKATGEVTLVEAMPEDESEKVFTRAAVKIRKHWKVGEFPDKTMFACG